MVLSHTRPRAEVQDRKSAQSATRCCKLLDRGARGHLPRTNGHAVAQNYVVVLEVLEEATTER